jgi:phospholipase/carboxylesterase
MSDLKFYEHSDTENPKYLVIFLHGYGANGENLLDLAHEFKRTLPEAHFISPNAVHPWEGGFPHAYQWFSLYSGTQRKSATDTVEEVKSSNKILRSFINAQLDRFNLTHDKLFLVGFSQGSMMAIYQGLTMPKAAGIISFSGRVILPETTGDKSTTKPEVCLIHGESDEVLPIKHLTEGKAILTQENITHEAHSFPNLEHTIDIRGIRAAQNFIKKQIS